MRYDRMGRDVLIACVCLVVADAAYAQTDETLLLEPWEKGAVLFSNTDALALAGNGGGSANHPFYEVESTGRYQLDTSRELNPTIGYDWTHLSTTGHSAPIPSQLDDISAAFGTPIALVGDWFFGGTAGVGYAGDAAFGDSAAWYGKGSVIMGTQLNRTSSLALFVDYDGNRTLLPDTPLPGFAYASAWGDTLQYTIGAPTSSLTWTPTNEFQVTLSDYFLTSIDAAAEYKIGGHWKLFAKYADRQDSFFDASLPSDRRLFYTERRVEVGTGYQPTSHLEIQLGVGYAFSREFSTGFDERSLHKLLSLSDEPYARLGLTIAY